MLIDLTQVKHIYVACGHTDMRKSIDGLTALIQQNFRLNPYENSLYLFCGNSAKRIKAVYWEGDGFLLLYKRLEDGRFQWPRDGEEARMITAKEFRRLAEGLSIDQPKAIRKVEKKQCSEVLGSLDFTGFFSSFMV
jgi:transposase